MKDSPAVSVNSDRQEIFCFTGNGVLRKLLERHWVFLGVFYVRNSAIDKFLQVWYAIWHWLANANCKKEFTEFETENNDNRDNTARQQGRIV